ERAVGLTFAFGELALQARRDEPLTGAIEHRRAVRGAPAPLPYVRHYHRAAEPLSQHHRLLEGRVGPRAAIESHQQSSEHAYGSTPKDSSSRSGNSRISPVIGSLPSSASSRSPGSSRSATTPYSGTAPPAAMSRECGSSGIACAVTSAATPLASSKLCR